MDSFQDFSKGNFTGVSLGRDGKLSLAPHLEELFATGQALVWATADDAAGGIYLGTGHSGKVFKLQPDPQGGMKAAEFFDAPEPDIFALAVDRQGNVYAGSSPDGKVYRIAADGRAAEFFNPQAKYIWSLALAADGSLFVATGDRGRIFRVAPDGAGALYYDTHQAHVMGLAVAPDGALIAGTEPNGLLFRIIEGKGFVLYDAPLAEIHSVAVAPDGSVLASAIAAGGARGRGAGIGEGGSGAEVMLSPQTITVQASQENAQGDAKDRLKPKPGEPDKAAAEKAAAERAARHAAAAASPVPAIDASAGTRSAIYRVAPDRTVETLWSSRDETVYDVLPAAQSDATGPLSLLFSTDERGRVYQLGADRQPTLLVQTNEEQTTRLMRRGAHVLAATSNLGKLFRLGGTSSRLGSSQGAGQGVYESPVKDTRSIARWGKLSWRAAAPAGARVEFFTRGGNSAAPDPTWSDWEPTAAQQAVRPDLFEAQVASPPARYLQWKAVFHGPAAVDEVSVAYLPQNRAPVIQTITVNPAPYAPSSRSIPATGSAAPAGGIDPMVVIVDDTGGVKTNAPQVVGGTSAGTPSGVRPGAPVTVIFAWEAEDPDADRLVYSLYLRGEGESQWKLVRDSLREPSLQMEPETLADGKYQVRVTASDSESNPPQSARTAELVSSPFLVDNTPPAVRLDGAPRRTGSQMELRFEAADAASVLRRAEYSIDGGAWLPVYSDDGIVDSRRELFTLSLSGVAAGEHVIVLRAYDSGGNAGIGRAVIR